MLSSMCDVNILLIFSMRQDKSELEYPSAHGDDKDDDDDVRRIHGTHYQRSVTNNVYKA